MKQCKSTASSSFKQAYDATIERLVALEEEHQNSPERMEGFKKIIAELPENHHCSNCGHACVGKDGSVGCGQLHLSPCVDLYCEKADQSKWPFFTYWTPIFYQTLKYVGDKNGKSNS